MVKSFEPSPPDSGLTTITQNKITKNIHKHTHLNM